MARQLSSGLTVCQQESRAFYHYLKCNRDHIWDWNKQKQKTRQAPPFIYILTPTVRLCIFFIDIPGSTFSWSIPLYGFLHHDVGKITLYSIRDVSSHHMRLQVRIFIVDRKQADAWGFGFEPSHFIVDQRRADDNRGTCASGDKGARCYCTFQADTRNLLEKT